MNLDITGKIALITGADSGMGKETARMLLQEGVRVAITDQPGGDLDASVEDLKAHGEVIAVEADLTKLDDVKALFAKVREQLGEPDILVNCAGVTGATGDFLDVDDAGWQSTIDINLMARCASAARRSRRCAPRNGAASC